MQKKKAKQLFKVIRETVLILFENQKNSKSYTIEFGFSEWTNKANPNYVSQIFRRPPNVGSDFWATQIIIRDE